jgi:small subunit ribosomal protein S4e
MHLKRQKATTKLPIQRKGTTFIVRASSHYKNSVPVVIALRDMLKLARTNKEVRKMINEKQLKINGKLVESPKESICLFNIFEADKPYILTLLPTGKFTFQPSPSSSRLVKITNKKLLKKNTIQLNFHDGSNILSKEKVNVNDSILLDSTNKITKHLSLEKGSSAFVISGKYIGQKGKIQTIKENKITIQIENKEIPAQLNTSQIVVQ